MIMRNSDEWNPDEDSPVDLDLDDGASERAMGWGLVGAFTGLMILGFIFSINY